MGLRGRRWRRIAILTAVAIVAIVVATPPLLRHVVTQRLQALVSEKLDAHLTVGRLSYNFPYGVVATDAGVIAETPEGTPFNMLAFSRLDLRLAKLPFGKGPLVIQSLVLQQPSVHLIRTANGIVGKRSLKSPPTDESAQAAWKLSNLLQLTHLELHAGRIEFEDRLKADSVPLVWKDLNLNIDTRKESPSGYGFKLVVDNAPLARLNAAGQADLDALVVKLDTFALAVTTDPASAQSPLPANLQEVLRQWKARGTLNIDLSANLLLQNLTASTYRCAIELQPSTATFPAWKMPIDRLALKLAVADGSDTPVEDGSRPAPGVRPIATIETFDARAGDSGFHLENVTARADTQSLTWAISGARGQIDPGRTRAALPAALRRAMQQMQLAGACDFALDGVGSARPFDLQHATGHLVLHPRDLTLQPPQLAEPISDLTDASFTLANGDLSVSTLRGVCGKHLLFLKEAHVAVADLPRRIRATGLSGCLTLGSGGKYPKDVAAILTPLQPTGPFFFSGSVDVDLAAPATKTDYDLKFHTTRARVTLGDNHVPISGIDATATLTPKRLVLSKLSASALEGSVDANGVAELAGDKPAAAGKLNCRAVNLKLLADALSKPGDKPLTLSGHGNLTADLSAPLLSDAALQAALTGHGEFEIRDGNFWQIPIMSAIARSLSRESVTMGEAAGIFHIQNNRVHFDRAVASAPLLGVQGSGDMGFDGKLDFKLIADLFGKWSDRVGDGDGGGVAKIIGGIQQGIDVATRQALYEVTVTGTTADPHAGAVPAPFIARQLQKLFNTAADPNRKGGLLGALHENTDTTHSP